LVNLFEFYDDARTYKTSKFKFLNNYTGRFVKIFQHVWNPWFHFLIYSYICGTNVSIADISLPTGHCPGVEYPYIQRVATFTYYKRRWFISPLSDLPDSCCSWFLVTTLYRWYWCFSTC